MFQSPVCRWPASLETLEEAILRPGAGEAVDQRWIVAPDESVTSVTSCQVTQCTFAMCSYREKKAEPQELLQLEGYTVDYCDPQPGTHTHAHTHTHSQGSGGPAPRPPRAPRLTPALAGLRGGALFFSALREGDLVTFSCEDEAERTLWLQALYRATGQAHKPVPQDRRAQNPAPPTSTFTCILSGGGGAPRPLLEGKAVVLQGSGGVQLATGVGNGANSVSIAVTYMKVIKERRWSPTWSGEEPSPGEAHL